MESSVEGRMKRGKKNDKALDVNGRTVQKYHGTGKTPGDKSRGGEDSPTSEIFSS